jgi:hypothetical protein
VQVDTPGPGNDRSLTADEARAWELIERDLRLRARRRHRIAGFVSRRVHRPLVIAGLLLVALGGVVAGAAALPVEAAAVAAGAVAGLGLLVIVLGVAGGGRRARGGRRRRSGRRSAARPDAAADLESGDSPGPEPA